MKKISKLLALFLVVLSISSLFTGCSNDEISLLNAYVKNQEINSMEAKTNIAIQLNVSGLSDEDQQKAAMFSQMLNNANITMNQKTVRDPKTGSAKAEVLSSFTLAGMTMNANAWVQTGIDNGTPTVKEIFQLPPMATMAFLKDSAGKDYIVLDTSKIPGQTSVPASIDYSKYNELNKELTEKTVTFFTSYMKNLKPGFTVIKSTGTKTVNGSNVSTYQLKLSDAQLKDLLNYIVEDLGTNKDNLKAIEEYIVSIMKVSATINPQAAVSEEDLNQAITEFEKQIPAFIETYSKYSDSLKNVKLLGNDGITIDYAVDKNGYIVNEDSKIDFNFDLGEIAKAVASVSGETLDQAVSGKISLKLNCTTEISKINEKVEVNIPEVNDSNSVDYFSMIEKMVGSLQKPENTQLVLVFVNDKYVNFKDEPVILNDRTMVPAREVIETLGGSVNWDDATQTVTAKFGNNTAVLKVDNTTAIINGETVQLDSPALMYKDRLYVPLRVLTNCIGANISWDESTSTVKLEVK
jgi:Copper amine oxidase N-terminal domain.